MPVINLLRVERTNIYCTWQESNGTSNLCTYDKNSECPFNQLIHYTYIHMIDMIEVVHFSMKQLDESGNNLIKRRISKSGSMHD